MVKSYEKNSSPKDPLIVLGGTSLRVYLFLLYKRKPVGVRELQRALGFRSPSTARHHLERLVELGLAEKTSDGYTARRPTGLLGLYVSLRGKIVPRLFAATAFSVTASIAYTLLPGADPAAIILLYTVSGILIYESLRLYRALASLVEVAREE